uniref:(northern house mosquito) hypothetical protein n=1 Tax=Culex pipiens TaxID=7175 RepID=A0A8D8BZ92_CULPI
MSGTTFHQQHGLAIVQRWLLPLQDAFLALAPQHRRQTGHAPYPQDSVPVVMRPDDHVQPQVAGDESVRVLEARVGHEHARIGHLDVVQVPLERRRRVGPAGGAVQLQRFAHVVRPVVTVPVDVGTVFGHIYHIHPALALDRIEAGRLGGDFAPIHAGRFQRQRAQQHLRVVRVVRIDANSLDFVALDRWRRRRDVPVELFVVLVPLDRVDLLAAVPLLAVVVVVLEDVVRIARTGRVLLPSSACRLSR